MGQPSPLIQMSLRVLAVFVLSCALFVSADVKRGQQTITIARRSYASGSSYTSGSAATTPTKSAVQITQVTTLNLNGATYSGDLKTFVEKSYGQSIGIWNAVTKLYEPKCSVTSAASRRADSTITFTAQVSSAKASVAKTKSAGLQNAQLTTAMN